MVLLAANQTQLANLQGMLTTTHHFGLPMGTDALQGRVFHGALGMSPLSKRY